MFDQNLLRRYLLGDLSLEERTSLEDVYLSDSSRFEDVVAAENDLLDAYARGELTESERRQIERHYSDSPERRAKIEFAKALRQIAQAERAAPSAGRVSWWRSLLTSFNAPKPVLQFGLACVAVLIVGVIWVALQNRVLRLELRQALADAAQLHQQQEAPHDQIAGLESRLQQSQTGEQGTQLATLETPAESIFVLTSGAVRSGGAGQHDFVLPPGHPWVRLELRIDRNEYKAYEARLLTPEGNEILHDTALKSQSIKGTDVVLWRIPSRSLQFGDYIVKLSGVGDDGSAEPVQSYSFRTVPK